jgi:hypothetical protein
VVTLIVLCVVLLLVFHVAGRWVRSRCEELDYGLSGPRDTAPHGSS